MIKTVPSSLSGYSHSPYFDNLDKLLTTGSLTSLEMNKLIADLREAADYLAHASSPKVDSIVTD